MIENGYKRTNEHRKHLSDAHKGKKHSEETKRKMSLAHKGENHHFWNKHHSIESRQKMSLSHKGQIPWNKGTTGWKGYWLGKKRPDMMGANNPRWCNGNYKKQFQRNDSAYREWARQVKKRDNNICKINNKDCSGYNIVHHILPWRDFPELRYEINNGITLCQAHHPRKRAEEKEFEDLFKSLIRVSNA